MDFPTLHALTVMDVNSCFLYFEGTMSVSSTAFFYAIKWHAQRVQVNLIDSPSATTACEEDDGLSGCSLAKSSLPIIYREQ